MPSGENRKASYDLVLEILAEAPLTSKQLSIRLQEPGAPWEGRNDRGPPRGGPSRLHVAAARQLGRMVKKGLVRQGLPPGPGRGREPWVYSLTNIGEERLALIHKRGLAKRALGELRELLWTRPLVLRCPSIPGGDAYYQAADPERMNLLAESLMEIWRDSDSEADRAFGYAGASINPKGMVGAGRLGNSIRMLKEWLISNGPGAR